MMLAGGGTGGHVYPALAVLEALRDLSPRIGFQWVGSERVESKIVPQARVPFHQIDIRFSYRWPTPANWGYYLRHIMPLALGRPFRQALHAVDAFRPHVLLATGGYVAAPVIWAALQRRIPVALLEINQPPGLVHRYFAGQAWRIYAATEAVAAHFAGRCSEAVLRVCGYPAPLPKRTRLRVYRDHELHTRRRLLLALGGSLGAGAVHRAVRGLLIGAQRRPDPRWSRLAVLNVGGERTQLLGAALAEAQWAGGPVQYRAVGYLDDCVGALHAADFYLGRSGAATVGELIACGIPALLIPDPQHADRQQYGNAQALIERGQGTILEERRVTGPAVLAWLSHVWSQPRLPAPYPPPAELIAADLLSVWEAR